MTAPLPDPAFWARRRVLVTGHTGFKGAWLCLLLNRLGARVSGLALPAPAGGAFTAMRPRVDSNLADVRDGATVAAIIRNLRPEIVLHLAAQPLVGEGYARPLETFATNVMGTAHVLEALHQAPATAALIVTTDKVYRAAPDCPPFQEDSPLGGTDPYSASKVAAEHAVACWWERLRGVGCRVATARAGNVLGGGDIALDRLAPDVIYAHRAGTPLVLRRPRAVRPWQYVLDVLSGYLLYVQALLGGDAPPALNFGPGQDANNPADVTAAALAERLQHALGAIPAWRPGDLSYHETATLRLDPTRALRTLGWRATTSVDRAVNWTAAWHQAVWAGHDMPRVGHDQVEAWMAA